MLADGIVEAFRIQAEFCGKFGSAFYAELLARAAEDIERGGPLARALDGWTGNPIPDALVLRLAGAVHRLVLDGEAPALARHYPSVGGTPDWPAAWEAFRAVVDARIDVVRAALDRKNMLRGKGSGIGTDNPLAIPDPGPNQQLAETDIYPALSAIKEVTGMSFDKGEKDMKTWYVWWNREGTKFAFKD